MDKHHCLFYLAGQMREPQELITFYRRMCAALHYSEQQISSFYLIYNTQYNLFHQLPLEDCSASVRRQLKNIDSCGSLCQKRGYGKYHITDHACILCTLSPLYRNAREKQERYVLRYLLKSGAPTAVPFDPVANFPSCFQMCMDYTVGTHPILQIHTMLCDYIKHQNNITDQNHISLDGEFIRFVSTHPLSDGIPHELFETEIFRRRIDMILAAIEAVPFDDAKEMFPRYRDLLLVPYNYKAPLPAMKKKQPVKKPEDAGQMTILHLFDQVETSGPAICPCTSPAQPVTKTTEEQKSPENNIKISDPEAEPFFSNSHLHRTWLSADAPFAEPVQILEDTSMFDFSAAVLKSAWVSCAPALRHGHEGLLLYVSSDGNYYYYNMELSGTEGLASLFSGTAPVMYTFHTYEIIELCHRHGHTFFPLHPLDLPAACAGHASSYPELFSSLFGHEQFWQENLSSSERIAANYAGGFADAGTHRLINRIILAFRVLATGSNIRTVFPEEERALMPVGIGAFVFRNISGLDIHCPGAMLTVQFKNISLGGSLLNESAYLGTLLSLAAMPHLHRSRYLLLDVQKERLTLFYNGSSDLFKNLYDLFLTAVQHSYYRQTGQMLESASFCNTYEMP